MKKVCNQCGKGYKTYRSSSKFCSRTCSAENQTKKIKLYCENCGSEYEMHKYREETSKFCSKKCRENAQYLLGYDGENKICTTCNELKPLSEFWKGRTKCKACVQERSRKYYEVNKDQIQKRNKKYRLMNLDREKSYKAKWRADNRKEIRDKHKKWRAENSDKVKLQRAKDEQARRARIRGSVFTLTVEEWLDTLNYFNHECAYCGASESLQMEHVIPVIKGGGYEKRNIIPSCEPCNLSKSNKDFFEWFDWKADDFSIDRGLKIVDFIERNPEESPTGNGSESVESRGRLRQ